MIDGSPSLKLWYCLEGVKVLFALALRLKLKLTIEIDSSIFGGKKSAIEIDLSTRRCGGKDFGL